MNYTSVTFGADNRTVVSNDGTLLTKAVTGGGGNATPDSQKANFGIQTRTGEIFRHNTATPGPATQSPGYTSAQLIAPDGKVQIGAYRTDPATVENLRVMAPEMFVAPEIKAAEAAKAANEARSEEITREDLNRHPDEQIEAAHQHFVGEVSQQNQIALMVYAHRGEAPPADLIKTIADQMHVPLHEAIDKVNAISMATQAQFTVLARSMGLDADAAADWIKAIGATPLWWLRRPMDFVVIYWLGGPCWKSIAEQRAMAWPADGHPLG
jgi:hypothetical protein